MLIAVRINAPRPPWLPTSPGEGSKPPPGWIPPRGSRVAAGPPPWPRYSWDAGAYFALDAEPAFQFDFSLLVERAFEVDYFHTLNFRVDYTAEPVVEVTVPAVAMPEPPIMVAVKPEPKPKAAKPKRKVKPAKQRRMVEPVPLSLGAAATLSAPVLSLTRIAMLAREGELRRRKRW
jgi:hypothetical protein